MSIGISKAKLPLGIFLAALLICISAVSLNFAADETNAKTEAFRQTAKQLLDVGYEQYQRGMYDEARKTLDKAAAYKQYLSVSDENRLETLLQQLGSQPAPQVQQPVDQNTTAKTQPPQTPAEEPIIIEPQVQPAPQIQPKPQIQITQPVSPQQQPVINPEYIEFVPIGPNDLGLPAQAPVLPKSQTEVVFINPAPQDVNIRIESNQPPQQQPQPVKVQTSAEQETKEDYIEVVKQKQRIQQSYTKAVINEAVAKARQYADEQEFSKAKDEISRAAAVVEKNKLLLEEADYTQYMTSLQQLSNEINTQRSEGERVKAEEAKAQAKATQEKLRAQQTTDRKKRIQDLLAASSEYQQQQKYEEALAQIDTLLAIDPINKEALRNKQMLEDIISLRKQLEIKKEIGKEEEALLTDTQRSMIPHAELITYPRNWQDIAERKAKTITGLSEADAAVYKQLDTLVDLSVLTPDTPFEEAIETIRTSVDPPLKIVVRWRDLEENAYVERDTVIGMQGISGVMLGKGLRELLNSVSGGVANIDFAVEDGVVTIATAGSLPARLVTHVYDITELIGAPADFLMELETQEGGGGGGEVEETTDIIAQNAATLVQLIQDTIAPMTWLINGGEGTLSLHGTRLVVSQTPQVHEQIQKLLMEDLRESLGQQISIETRFLFVTENFLEDIGFGIDQLYIKGPGKFSDMFFGFDQYGGALPESSLVPGSLPPSYQPPIGSGDTFHAAELLGTGLTYGTPILDDLAVSFFLRATQAHRDAKMLTAPRVTVLSGESAYIRVTREDAYVSDYEFEDITTAGEGQPVRVIADATIETETGGVVLNVTPTITADKKYVILRISTNYTRTSFEGFNVSSTVGDQFPIELPTLEVSEVQTRVSVPDGGTLLIGGQKLGAEINKESGVPGISKMPILGRLFSHRSKVKDQDVLLVLVKPSIILQEEKEREFFAPLD